MIEYIDVQRQMDGKVIIRKTNNNGNKIYVSLNNKRKIFQI